MAETWVSKVELVELIGRSAAETLCKTYGGVPIYVPVRADPKSALGRIVGTAALAVLSKEFGSLQITVPNGRREEAAKKEILRQLEAGRSACAIALELGVTERYVRRVAANRRRGLMQYRLF